jgi:hypothetical protein
LGDWRWTQSSNLITVGTSGMMRGCPVFRADHGDDDQNQPEERQRRTEHP